MDSDTLTKVQQSLNEDPKWLNLNENVRQRVLDNLHEEVAGDLISQHQAKIDPPKPKAPKVKKVNAKRSTESE